MNLKLDKKKIIIGAIVAGAVLAPITGVYAYETLSSKTKINTNIDSVEYTEENKQMLQGEMNDQNRQELPEGEMRETPPEKPTGEMNDGENQNRPLKRMKKEEQEDEENVEEEIQEGDSEELMEEKKNEEPPEKPDGNIQEKENKTLPSTPLQEEKETFVEMFKSLPKNFVEWLKKLFKKEE